MKSLKIAPAVLALMLAGASGAAYAQAFVAPPIGDTANAALEEQNKALVLRLYSEVFATGDQAVAAEIVSPDAVEHSKTEGKGVEGQLAIFNELKSRIPNVAATVKHAGADGDFVAVQWHASATPADEFSGEEWIDFYRVTDGKIVEVWSASEAITPSVSGNSPFSDLYVYPNGAPTLTEEQEEANKQLIEQSNQELAANTTLATLEKFWAKDFFQHNPGQANGTEAMAATFPGAGGPPAGGAGGPPPGGPGGAGGPPAGGAGGPPPGGPGGPGGAPPAGPGGGAGGPPPFQPVAYLADGDIVYEMNTLGNGSFLVDLYKVADNKIVEHYDIAPNFGPPAGGPAPTPPAQ